MVQRTLLFSTSDEAAAKVVRSLRQAQSLSQERLAELANLHRTYISLLERGKRSPTLATLDLLARALGLTPSDLLTRIGAAMEEGCVDGDSCARHLIEDVKS